LRVLLVEDHAALREMAAAHLVHRGFTVDAVAGAQEARAALAAAKYDALVLDLGLPDGDGMAVLKEAHARTGGDLPVLIVTARDAVEDRIRGLDAGADDYIVKPFDILELEARLRAVLRRPGSRRNPLLRCADLVFDPASREASAGGVPIELTRREADLLEILLRAGRRMVVRDELAERLYSFDEEVTPNALEATVSRLRRRLAGTGVRIENRRGIGYRLQEEPPAGA
jgi:DNA-binding response OmpR family regulator